MVRVSFLIKKRQIHFCLEFLPFSKRVAFAADTFVPAERAHRGSCTSHLNYKGPKIIDAHAHFDPAYVIDINACSQVRNRTDSNTVITDSTSLRKRPRVWPVELVLLHSQSMRLGCARTILRCMTTRSITVARST